MHTQSAGEEKLFDLPVLGLQLETLHQWDIDFLGLEKPELIQLAAMVFTDRCACAACLPRASVVPC